MMTCPKSGPCLQVKSNQAKTEQLVHQIPCLMQKQVYPVASACCAASSAHTLHALWACCLQDRSPLLTTPEALQAFGCSCSQHLATACLGVQASNLAHTPGRHPGRVPGTPTSTTRLPFQHKHLPSLIFRPWLEGLCPCSARCRHPGRVPGTPTSTTRLPFQHTHLPSLIFRPWPERLCPCSARCRHPGGMSGMPTSTIRTPVQHKELPCIILLFCSCCARSWLPGRMSGTPVVLHWGGGRGLPAFFGNHFMQSASSPVYKHNAART
eukprot:1158202-Pelagomonas_calceolata.AAC.7